MKPIGQVMAASLGCAVPAKKHQSQSCSQQAPKEAERDIVGQDSSSDNLVVTDTPILLQRLLTCLTHNQASESERMCAACEQCSLTGGSTSLIRWYRVKSARFTNISLSS
mgnify:CR=1 FL=1